MIRVPETAVRQAAAALGLPELDGAAEAAAVVSALAGGWTEENAQDVTRPAARDPLGAIVSVLPLTQPQAGPLAGRLLAVKDNMAVAGAPTAMGTGSAGVVAPADCTLVARARRAGAIVAAKAQCEAFLAGGNSFSSRPRPVLNPHDLRRSAGGSSSGSAAATAAGLVDFALATDAGGSARTPAAYCGVVGFKPSRGRLSYAGVAPLEPFLEHAGVIAADVERLRELFAAIDGADPLDPRCAWASRRDAPVAPRPIDELRLGVFEAGFAEADPAVAATLEAALARLGSAGARLTPLPWPEFEAALDLHLAIYVTGQAMTARAGGPAGFASSLPAGWVRWRADATPDLLPAPLTMALAAGEALIQADPELHARAVRESLSLADRFERALSDVDALLLPTTRTVAPIIPSDPSADDIYGDTRLSMPFNVVGGPALSLPAGRAGGLPVGLQLVGRRGEDFALLAVASALETFLGPWPRPVGDFGSLR
jgi:amidase